MKRFLVLACFVLACARSTAAEDLAARVVILANEADEDSVRIARYYAEKRGVSAENIIALPMPTVETITWRDFVLSIWQPLQDELIRREWIDALQSQEFDDVGRRNLVSSGHRLSYLVVCRGVPLRINHNPELFREQPGLRERSELRTNRSAVDSELALLAFGHYDINALVPNPLFRSRDPSVLVQEMIVKVGRLDGPQFRDVIALIDGTLEAERRGLVGRAYADVRGPHRQGEQWMRLIVDQTTAMDFRPTVHDEAGTFPEGARFDAPALYFGWYATNANGPFRLPGFRLAPGAIAVHIHSYSAGTLRSDTSGWCGPLVARGAAATTGAVFEPYLQFMHFPHVMLAALAEGQTLGDAATVALPCFSWMNVLIGDPLYRPFARSEMEQWLGREQLPAGRRPYVAVREMQRLDRVGEPDAALALARRELQDQPSLALGVELATRLQAKGDLAGAADAIGFATYLRSVPTNDWALLKTAADILQACGRGGRGADGAAAPAAFAGPP
ncbi:MAG: TIGR03790 family protein [Cephaloticoccus sp.]